MNLIKRFKENRKLNKLKEKITEKTNKQDKYERNKI